MQNLTVAIQTKTNKVTVFLLTVLINSGVLKIIPLKWKRVKIINFLLKRLIKYRVGDSNKWKYIDSYKYFEN